MSKQEGLQMRRRCTRKLLESRQKKTRSVHLRLLTLATLKQKVTSCAASNRASLYHPLQRGLDAWAAYIRGPQTLMIEVGRGFSRFSGHFEADRGERGGKCVSQCLQLKQVHGWMQTEVEVIAEPLHLKTNSNRGKQQQGQLYSGGSFQEDS
jgi:hypothetical protein